MDLAEHYRQLFLKYGDSPMAVQWSNLESQNIRFQILSEIANLNHCSILDLGCGTGQLATYLKKNNIHVQYTGVDIVDEFLECAAKKHPEHDFCKLDKALICRYDYVLISGVFNNEMSDNRSFYMGMIEKLFPIVNKGLAFNMLSYYVDYYDKGLFYEKPETVFEFIKQKITPYVVIRNDYQIKEGIIPFEFTVYAYKK